MCRKRSHEMAGLGKPTAQSRHGLHAATNKRDAEKVGLEALFPGVLLSLSQR